MDFDKGFPDERLSDELIGRVVTNALGQPETVVMERIYWEYLDWLDAQGQDVESYIKRCDREREDVPFSSALMWWTFCCFKNREREGKPRPTWLPPIDWDDED